MLLAVDPGGTTGIAIRLTGHEPFTLVEPDKKNVWATVNEFAQTCGPNGIVIIEQFASVWTDQYRIHTIELVGAVEALCFVFDVKCVRRVPQHRYPAMKEAKAYLDARGGPYMEHELDALAHLLAFERRKVKDIGASNG